MACKEEEDEVKVPNTRPFHRDPNPSAASSITGTDERSKTRAELAHAMACKEEEKTRSVLIPYLSAISIILSMLYGIPYSATTFLFNRQFSSSFSSLTNLSSEASNSLTLGPNGTTQFVSNRRQTECTVKLA